MHHISKEFHRWLGALPGFWCKADILCVAILHMSSIQSYFDFQSHYHQPYIPACNTSLFHLVSGICYLYTPSLRLELLPGLPSCSTSSRSTILAGL